MIKSLRKALAFLLMLSFFSQCEKPQDQPDPSGQGNTPPAVIVVESVSLDKTTLSLTIGETAQLQAGISPASATDKTVTWSSSAVAVATVSDKGLVTAIGKGEATITVSSSNGKKADCQVIVTEKTVAVSSIILDMTSLNLEEEEEAQLIATVGPDDATDKTVRWSSSDENVASVDETGKVKAVKAGSAQVTAAAGELSAVCEVTVTAKVVIPEFSAVDMGLSVKWANMNLGASDVSEPGSFYAWGETKVKSNYEWSNYSFSGETEGSVTKYGDIDDMYVLLSADDVASVRKGDGWRIPTKHEFKELVDNCEKQWSEEPEGYYLVSKVNGNSIFLPAVGYMEGRQKAEGISLSRYWTSSTGSYDGEAVYYSMFNSMGMSLEAVSGDRSLGYSVRPVQGTGVSVPEAKIRLEGNLVNFGQSTVGQSRSFSVKVMNEGDADLVFYVDRPAVVLDSDHFSENFSIEGNAAGSAYTQTVPAGGTGSFTVWYKPDEAEKEEYARFVVYTNAINGNKPVLVKGHTLSSGMEGNSNEGVGYGDWNF